MKQVLVTLCMVCFSVGTSYHASKEFSGKTFFDDWLFYDDVDNLTNGMVVFASASSAAKTKLAYINSAGNAIMRVDNTTTLKLGQKRNSVRISSKDRFAVGSVWVADMLHVPFGCSTWPAFWSQAEVWPEGGEIDTFEGVNQIGQNTMSLHTEPGCTHQANATQSSTIINTIDCDSRANANSGCGVADPNNSSYGAPFARAGGGVFVTEFAETGISVWFFSRQSVPSTLQNNASTLDTSTLGLPVANWPTASCAINQYFAPQRLIFDITLCGDFAGQSSVFAKTCPGLCYEDWVLGPPSNFDDAYFEVQSVRVYSADGLDTVIVGSGAFSRWTGRLWWVGVVGVLIGMHFDFGHVV
ncbi:hypothetical protein BD410DRAFT_791798 [Rickenella mellea]|uniref:Uncharacterized protein n=1 Tax=Rickenella mellea TaxID=50990 RepID=A0A4Y7PXB2_9AGAM|nr:hypothetical protein BD410DRAFT_791798 [Rickenella mellea]